MLDKSYNLFNAASDSTPTTCSVPPEFRNDRYSPFTFVQIKPKKPKATPITLTKNTCLKFNLSTIFQNQNFSDDEFKFGGEIAYDESFFIRGGYMLSQETVVDSYSYGVTFGAGITQNLDGIDFTFDYAYQQMNIFDGNHVFSIKMGF